jgi:hypothetical protein
MSREEVLITCWAAIGGEEADLRQGEEDFRLWRGVKVEKKKGAVVGLDWGNCCVGSRYYSEGVPVQSVPPEFGALVALNALQRLEVEQPLQTPSYRLTLVQAYVFVLVFALWFPIFYIGCYLAFPWVPLFTMGFVACGLALAVLIEVRGGRGGEGCRQGRGG